MTRTTLSRRDLMALGAALALPAAAAATGVQDGVWLDERRRRRLPWRLRLPTGAAAGEGPWPLVLYSHGLGGSREGAPTWGEAWAAAGIAVLHLQHPGSDAEVLRGGASALRAAASADELINRLQDLRFAINQLVQRADETPWRQIRRDAIGVAGHSFGAVTAQAVAGQRYPIPGDLSDPRPRAFIALSPSMPVGTRMSAQDAFGAITRPMFLLTGSHDTSPLGKDQAAEQRAAVYNGLPPGQRALLWLDGADHMTFGGRGPDDALAQGARRPESARQKQAAHHALIAHLTSLWWRAHLLDDAASRAALTQPQTLGPQDRFTLG